MSCRCVFIADESKPSATCHCAGCHQTFSGVSSFDLHQRLDDGKVVCLSPAYARNQKGSLIFASVRRTPDGKPVWGRALTPLRGHRVDWLRGPQAPAREHPESIRESEAA